MARKFKKGIDYFSHDVGMSNNLEIRLLRAKYKLQGYAIYNLLLEDIYKLGYYMEITEDYTLLFSAEHSIDPELLIEIIEFMISKKLFDPDIYNNHSVLTSKRIQSNYIEATGRRKDINLLMYNLLNINNAKIQPKVINANINGDNVNINSKNADISTQIKTNKNKTKQIKEKNNIILNLWNEFAESNNFKKIISLTESRIKYLELRLSENEFDFEKILTAAKNSNWLMNKYPELNFDFLINNNSNYIKLLEGNYNESFKNNLNTSGNKIKDEKEKSHSGNYQGFRKGQSNQQLEPRNKIVFS